MICSTQVPATNWRFYATLVDPTIQFIDGLRCKAPVVRHALIELLPRMTGLRGLVTLSTSGGRKAKEPSDSASGPELVSTWRKETTCE